jgi:hypothetical protein
MGEERSVYMVLMGKPEGKKPFVRRKHGWTDNIKMDLEETGREACTGLIWLVMETGVLL